MEQENNIPVKPVEPKSKPVLGYTLIAIGVIFLFERIFEFSFFQYFAWEYIWPVLVILLGIHLVIKRSK